MGTVDTVEWACVLCGCHIQSDWVSRRTKLHQILKWAWTFLCRNCLDGSGGCSYGQLVIGSLIRTTCLLMHHILCSFFVKHQINQVIQPPYSPDLLHWDFWFFQKLKSPLKRKKFQTVDEIQENMTGQWMAMGRTVWGPKVPTLNIHTMFLVSCIFFNKSPCFSCYMAGYLLDRPRNTSKHLQLISFATGVNFRWLF